MTDFHYNSFSENGEVIHPKGVELFILSNIIHDMMGQEHEYRDEQEGSLKPFPYDEVALKNLSKITHKGLAKDAIEVVIGVNADLRIKILAAIEKIKQREASLITLSNFDEMAIFFKEVILQCLERYEVVSKTEEKEGVTLESITHLTTVEAEHNGNLWQYKMTRELNGELTRRVVVNGMESPTMIGDAQWVDMALSMMAIMSQKDITDEYQICQYDRNPTYAKQAKAVASIVGGDYKQYLILVATINNQDGLIAGLTVSKDSAIYLLLSDALRASEAQLREVAKIFSDKPQYH